MNMQKTLKNKLKKISPHQRQWLWFVGLWCGGLASVMFLAYLIRLAMGID